MGEAKELEGQLEGVCARLRELDGVRALAASRVLNLMGGKMDISTSEEVLEAIQQLERLAELSDASSLSAALAEGGGGPAAAAPPELAEAERAELVAGRAVELLERAGQLVEPELPEPQRLLAEQLQQCLEEAREAGLRTRQDSVSAPPPPIDDDSPHAQAARLPAVAALAEAARDARAGLGASEVRRRMHRPEPVGLGVLLEALRGAVGLAGADPLDIAGVADEVAVVQPGDAIILPWAGAGCEALASRLAEAAGRGAAAAVLFGAPAEEATRAEAERALGAAAGLQAVAVVADPLAPAELARRFFGSPAERLRVVGVLGDDPIAVRTAVWLLGSALEREHGAAQTALLSSRRSLVGDDFVDVNRPLTACSVQELLAEAVARGVEWCVAEALLAGHRAGAFAGVPFACSVDLSREGGGAELEQLRAEVLGQTADEGAVQMAGGGHAQCGLQMPDTQTATAAAATDAQVKALGIMPVEQYQFHLRKYMAKEKLLSKGHDKSSLKGASQNALFQLLLDGVEQEQEPEPGILMGTVLDALQAAYWAPDFELRPYWTYLRLRAAGGLTATLRLPLIGASAARGALGACRAALATCASDAADLEQLRSALEDAGPPPGVLEVHTAGSPTSICAVYHEASTPQEVRDALVAVREWLQPRDGGTVRLISVLGCEGEVRRGDRAKYGWALAEYCDEVVLTSNHPRSEPAMQIVEDVLEAIRGRVRCTMPGDKGRKSRPFPVRSVHVVADRVDAIKLAVCSSAQKKGVQSENAVALIFGSGTYDDFQEAPDAHGRVRHWMCNDRRILLEALECAEKLSHPKSPFTIHEVPWAVDPYSEDEHSKTTTLVSAPKESLHWTYWVDAGKGGTVDRRL